MIVKSASKYENKYENVFMTSVIQVMELVELIATQQKLNVGF
jgi:hypothetical protein